MDKINHLLTHRVPREITSHIFAQCLSSERHPYRRELIRRPLVLGAVCQLWREIAWTTPQLWTTIAIIISTRLNPSLQLELLNQWIARSGQLPLHVSLRAAGATGTIVEIGPVFYPLIDLLNRYASRWRSLYLSVPRLLLKHFTEVGLGTMSNLTDLSLITLGSSYIGNGWSAPERFRLGTVSPRSLQLANVSLAYVDIKWNNLTQLKAILCVDEIREIFHHAHQLVRCELGCFAAEHRIPETPVVLRCLQHLEIEFYDSADASEIIDMITTPSLRQLGFDLEGGLPIESFKSFIIRSKCNLEVFNRSGSIATGELIAILSQLPSSLKQLSLDTNLDNNPHPWLTEEVWTLFKSARNHDDDASEDRFFPNLESFYFDGLQTFSWSDVIGTFFGSPSVPCIANHRLRSLAITVTFSWDQWPVEPIDPDTLHAIHGLRETALITIKKRDPETDNIDDLIKFSMIYHGLDFK